MKMNDARFRQCDVCKKIVAYPAADPITQQNAFIGWYELNYQYDVESITTTDICSSACMRIHVTTLN